MVLSAESQALLQQICAYLLLPIMAWLSYRTARFVESKQIAGLDDETSVHHLILTSRFGFVLAGTALLALAAKNFSDAPPDYLWICVGCGTVLLLYPAVSNVVRLKKLGVLGLVSQLGLALAIIVVAYSGWVAWNTSLLLNIDTLREYVALLTWQVLALVAGVVFFPQLYRMMGGVREFNLFGFKGRLETEETKDAEEEAEQEAQEVIQNEGPKEALQEAANEQADSPIERYKAAMKVWSVVAYIVRDLAVAKGSTNDAANQTREQIDELQTNGTLSKAQASRAKNLLDLRNKWKRNSERPIEHEAFKSFIRRSKRLGRELSQLNARNKTSENQPLRRGMTDTSADLANVMGVAVEDGRQLDQTERGDRPKY